MSRWLLLIALAPSPSASAQPTSMAGYVVAVGGRSQTVHTAPPGWVGRKTTDTERRVANTESTRGTEATFTFTFGGFTRSCPTADGVVDGNFEYALTSEVKTVPGQTLQRRYSRQLVAQLRGEVGSDARLIKVELFGAWTIETHEPGMPPSRETQPVRQTFLPGAAVDWPAIESAVLQTGDLGVAAMMMWAGEFYKAAEANWIQPGNCVEFAFDPPSRTRSLGPNEPAQVRVELRTKAGGLPVPWTTADVRAIGGVGTVSPRPAQALATAPTATLTYTASSQPRRGHGIDLSTTSRAGAAGGQWTITERGRPEWSGTITVVETVISRSSGEGSFGQGGHTIDETETEELKVTVTDGVDESGTEAHSSLSGRLEGRYQRLKTYTRWVLSSCGSIKNRRMNDSGRETSSGSAGAASAISVSLSDDGTYVISATSGDVVMPVTGQFNGHMETLRNGARDCVVGARTDSQEHAPLERTIGGLIQVAGKVDPKAPNVLAGSKTEESSEGSGVKRVKTTTWQFTRR